MIKQTAWSWRHAILKSSLPSTTRHVLLTLSCHMNDVGEGCFPSTKTLAMETGLSERSVCTHLELAETRGWITREQHGFRGSKWKRNEYRPMWPSDETDEPSLSKRAVKALKDVQHHGTEPNDKKALKDVQSNIPVVTAYQDSGTDYGTTYQYGNTHARARQ